jgi:hypothetical protein
MGEHEERGGHGDRERAVGNERRAAVVFVLLSGGLATTGGGGKRPDSCFLFLAVGRGFSLWPFGGAERAIN